jgi:Sec-independent protein translocase protein TatA
MGKEISMAPTGGKLKRVILITLFLVLFAVAFVLLGGGNLLKTAGTWIGGMGSKAETFKGKIEEGAQSVEKKAEKVKEAVTSAGKNVEKKAEKVKEAVTSGEKK